MATGEQSETRRGGARRPWWSALLGGGHEPEKAAPSEAGRAPAPETSLNAPGPLVRPAAPAQDRLVSVAEVHVAHDADAPTPQRPLRFRVEVLDGVHAGAAADVDAGRILVGGRLENDLVLSDLGEARYALELGPDGVTGSAADAPRPAPCVIALGPVRLRIDAERTAAPQTA